MKLNDRQRAFLEVLAEHGSLHAGRVVRLAEPDAPYRGRRDAGATRTLDVLERQGLVRGWYLSAGVGGRNWTITDAGRQAIA